LTLSATTRRSDATGRLADLGISSPGEALQKNLEEIADGQKETSKETR
jgi:hypothetical protein